MELDIWDVTDVVSIVITQFRINFDAALSVSQPSTRIGSAGHCEWPLGAGPLGPGPGPTLAVGPHSYVH